MVIRSNGVIHSSWLVCGYSRGFKKVLLESVAAPRKYGMLPFLLLIWIVFNLPNMPKIFFPNIIFPNIRLDLEQPIFPDIELPGIDLPDIECLYKGKVLGVWLAFCQPPGGILGPILKRF